MSSRGDVCAWYMATEMVKTFLQALFQTELSASRLPFYFFFVLFLHLNFNGLSEAWSSFVLPGSDVLVSPQNNDNETALHCAAQYGHTEVVKVLLEELTDPTMRNNKFETPLDLAALYGRLEVVKMLLNAHPNLLSCNTKKHTPLHLAARNGHKTVVHVLLDAGMDSNYQVSRVSVCEGLV